MYHDDFVAIEVFGDRVYRVVLPFTSFTPISLSYIYICDQTNTLHRISSESLHIIEIGSPLIIVRLTQGSMTAVLPGPG